MANRRDCPEYVKRMQLEMLDAMAAARSAGELGSVEPSVREIHDTYATGLRSADANEMVVNHRIGKLDYDKDCLQRSALKAYARLGVELEPGMTVGYVVRDARRRIVDAEWDARGFDAAYYAGILEKASAEVAFAFESARRLSKRGEMECNSERGAITSWRRASTGSSPPPA